MHISFGWYVSLVLPRLEVEGDFHESEGRERKKRMEMEKHSSVNARIFLLFLIHDRETVEKAFNVSTRLMCTQCVLHFYF